MRTSSFLSDHLRQFLRLKTIATLPELKQALGTTVDTTVFRKLKELSYRSSYSHRGRYYTLAEIPQFDSEGLWFFQTVWFSRWGNLVTTMEALVNGAPQGYFANELQQVLHVEVKDALLQQDAPAAVMPRRPVASWERVRGWLCVLHAGYSREAQARRRVLRIQGDVRAVFPLRGAEVVNRFEP